MDLFAELLQRIEGSIQLLADKPEETTDGTLRALWWTAAGAPRSAERAAADPLPGLDAAQADQLRDLVRRRLSGVPLCYLTGRQQFMGLEMYSAPGALIPRKETEILGWTALALIAEAASRRGQVNVVDVCTGSANLALAFAAYAPLARVYAADISDEAIAVARENARRLGLEGRVELRTGDLLAPFCGDLAGRVDVLCCNPPYISSGKVGQMHADISQHEPGVAFDGGPFGISILNRIIKESVRVMRPAGWLCLEVGLGQGPAVAQRISASRLYGDVRSAVDQKGSVRALAAQVKES